MKVKPILLFSLTLLCSYLFFVSSVAAQKVVEAAPDSVAAIMGSLDGRRYSNQVLKFELKLPHHGVILNHAEIDVYKKAGTDFYKQSSPKNNSGIEASLNSEIIILNYAIKPIGTPGNATLVIGVISQPSSATVSGVVAATLKNFSGNSSFQLTKSLTGIGVGGLKADGLDFIITMPTGVKLRERALVIIRDGYSVTFAITALDDDGISAVQSLLNNIKFISK